MVSHDRDLLNDVCDHIMHHRAQQKLVAYTGDYDSFERTRAERLEQRRGAARQERGPAQAHAGLRRPLQGQGSKARQAQSRMKMIEKLGAVVAAADRGTHRLSTFPRPSSSPRRSRRSTRSRSATPGPLVLKQLDLRLDMDDRIALLGQNGNGKSTFIRLLSDKLAPARRQGEAHAASCASATSRRTRRKASTTRARRSST